jgi:SRSO17 transposase
LEGYTTGLLTELRHRNNATITQAVPGTSEQHLQTVPTNMQWDAEDLNRQRAMRMIADAGLEDGVLVLDDTGFLKQGKRQSEWPDSARRAWARWVMARWR